MVYPTKIAFELFRHENEKLKENAEKDLGIELYLLKNDRRAHEMFVKGSAERELGLKAFHVLMKGENIGLSNNHQLQQHLSHFWKRRQLSGKALKVNTDTIYYNSFSLD